MKLFKSLSITALLLSLISLLPVAASAQTPTQFRMVNVTSQFVCTVQSCQAFVTNRKELRITGDGKTWAYLVLTLVDGKMQKAIVMRDDVEMWDGGNKETCTTFRLPEGAMHVSVTGLMVNGEPTNMSVPN